MVTGRYNVNHQGQSRKHPSTLNCNVYYAGSINNYYKSCDVNFIDLRHLCDMRRRRINCLRERQGYYHQFSSSWSIAIFTQSCPLFKLTFI